MRKFLLALLLLLATPINLVDSSYSYPLKMDFAELATRLPDPVLSHHVTKEKPRLRSIKKSIHKIKRIFVVRKPFGRTFIGIASWYGSWCNCNAMTSQIWRGKVVNISGPAGQTRILINDAGPIASLGRVADLNPTVFQTVCGNLGKGTCTVKIWR